MARYVNTDSARRHYGVTLPDGRGLSLDPGETVDLDVDPGATPHLEPADNSDDSSAPDDVESDTVERHEDESADGDVDDHPDY
jgi:hypothetical protein